MTKKAGHSIINHAIFGFILSPQLLLVNLPYGALMKKRTTNTRAEIINNDISRML